MANVKSNDMLPGASSQVAKPKKLSCASLCWRRFRLQWEVPCSPQLWEVQRCDTVRDLQVCSSDRFSLETLERGSCRSMARCHTKLSCYAIKYNTIAPAAGSFVYLYHHVGLFHSRNETFIKPKKKEGFGGLVYQ